MRGPKPRPTRLKIMDGNPGKRALNKSEPQPLPANLRPPAVLSREARREWRKLAPELHRLGLLTVLDIPAMIAWCDVLATCATCRKKIAKEGVTYRSKGLIKLNPAVATLHQAVNLASQLGQQFGWSPSSRSRLSVEPKVPESKAAKYLG